MLETGIYVRVSTEEQAKEGFSIRAQEQKLKDYARIKEWSIHKIYIDDGISGKNITDRPQINQLINDIKKGFIKNVLIFKIDRLTRNTADLIYLINLFNEYNCAFNSLCESIDTQTPSGRMFIKIIGIFAEFERENIVERTKLGFERKVKEGYSLCTRTASYGYDKYAGDKIQKINEKEAVIVREVFDMFVHHGTSFLDIAKNLNERHIPTKENSVWIARSIRNMLTNCNYIGKVRYATKDEERNFEVQGNHEPIISNELYEEAQELIRKISKKSYTKRPKEENYFSGVLYCSKCGARLVTHNDYYKNKNGDKIYRGGYRCSNYIRKMCNASNISQKNVETAFLEYIEQVEDFSAMSEIQLEENRRAKDNNSKLIEKLNNQLNNLENKEKEILSSYVDNNLNFDRYIQLKDYIETEKFKTHEQLAEIPTIEKDNEEMIIKKEDIIKSLKENWAFLTNEEKRLFLIKFISKIVIVNEMKNSRRGVAKITDIKFNTD